MKTSFISYTSHYPFMPYRRSASPICSCFQTGLFSRNTGRTHERPDDKMIVRTKIKKEPAAKMK